MAISKTLRLLVGVLAIATLSKACDEEKIKAFAADLQASLSEDARITYPGSEEFANATFRWSTYGQPTFAVAVDVATEADVSQTVNTANAHSLQFLATSGRHGAIKTLAGLSCGVDINLRNLKNVEVQADGQTAIIQGGISTKGVTDALWKVGKWTVTGICESTSLMGPGLGGGHGWNQGRFGLGVDQFVEANLVLGNGSTITVSDDSHSDLFWALRGAGHNFGIVTSIKYRVYDVPENNTWIVGQYGFTQDKLEALFGLLNEFTAGGEQPVELRYWATFVHNLNVDPVNAAILLWFVYEGTEEQAAPYTSQLEAIGPATTTYGITDYPGLGALTGNNLPDNLTSNLHILRFPIGTKSFNLTAHRKAFDIFNNVTITYPALNGSAFLNEGYSVKAVQAIPNESTAYPERFNNLLISANLRNVPDPFLDQVSTEAGLEIRRVLLEGTGSSEMNTYVNYVVGDESLEDWYGHEEWRIERLRALKAMYDPDHKFSFYAPIE
ncbi:hypothetical protein E8E14_012044 [Neopestalotiopsis sp. 37M]|nr:hypothetical protein E8E14_012044 [Neopestalotiopsis sp. 37M]